jgi:Helix-turn-helix domain
MSTRNPRTKEDRRRLSARRKLSGRRREDRNGLPPKTRRDKEPKEQLPMFATMEAIPERRKSDRRAATAEGRRSGGERRTVPGEGTGLASAQASKVKASKPPDETPKSRLVPCASDSAWMNSIQTAERIGTTRRGLYNMVRRGHFRAHRRTGARRGVMLFNRAEVEAFLAKR